MTAQPRLPTVQFVSRPGILDLGWGHPHPDALPVQRWRVATEQTLASAGDRALTYGHAAGPGELREWLAERDSIGDAANVFVTAGASHALELLTLLLARPGDVVLVDCPTYHLALRIFADAGVELVAAPSDEEGIDPAGTGDLVRRLRRAGRSVSLLYSVPTFANPTGATLSADRRVALTQVAAGSGLTLIEDDTYRDLAYGDAAPPTLWSLSDQTCVVRVGSFSKSVAPGLRLGWVNAARSIVERLERRGYIDSGGGVNHATAMTMATFGSSGSYELHLADVRRRYASQRDTLLRHLAREAGLVMTPPRGGWFAWARLPEGVSAAALLVEAERRGVSFVAGSQFHVDGRGDDHIRLAFSMLGPDETGQAVQRLGAALRAVR